MAARDRVRWTDITAYLAAIVGPALLFVLVGPVGWALVSDRERNPTAD